MKTGKVRKKIQLNNNDEAPRGAALNITEQKDSGRQKSHKNVQSLYLCLFLIAPKAVKRHNFRILYLKN